MEDLILVMESRAEGPKSIRNYVGTLSSLMRFAICLRPEPWARTNPCEHVELPAAPRYRGVIRLLEPEQVYKLAESVGRDPTKPSTALRT